MSNDIKQFNLGDLVHRVMDLKADATVRTAMREPSVITGVHEDSSKGFSYQVQLGGSYQPASALVKHEDAQGFTMDFLVGRLKEVIGWK